MELSNCSFTVNAADQCSQYCNNPAVLGSQVNGYVQWCETANSSGLSYCIADKAGIPITCQEPRKPANGGGKHNKLSVLATLLCLLSAVLGVSAIAPVYKIEPYYVGPTTTNGEWSNVSSSGLPLSARDRIWCGEECQRYTSSGYAVVWGIFADANCQSEVYQQLIDVNEGETACEGSKLCHKMAQDPGQGTVFVKILAGPEQGGTLEFTRAQTCPENSGAGTFAEVTNLNTCIQLASIDWQSVGINWYQCGKIPFKRSDLRKRDVECNAFSETERIDTYAATVRVTETTDCRGSGAPCPISLTSGFSKSVTTEWSVTVGVNYLFGSASATAGQSYTDTEEWSYTSQISVPQNQIGYVGGTARALLIRGKATECSDGNEYDTEATVFEKNSKQYSLVIVTDP